MYLPLKAFRWGSLQIELFQLRGKKWVSGPVFRISFWKPSKSWSSLLWQYKEFTCTSGGTSNFRHKLDWILPYQFFERENQELIWMAKNRLFRALFHQQVRKYNLCGKIWFQCTTDLKFAVNMVLSEMFELHL